MKPCKITIDLYNTFRERMPEYVQYDRNVPLEITVLENGKPADLNGLFGRLLVSKPDGHEVYSNDVEISGNVITTTLGEQVFTASGVAQVTVDILDEQNSKRALVPFGMRIRSAVITDESIKSSNDYQTITALISDVRALNAMFHVEQEQRAEAFNAQMQSQEATFTEAQRQFLADHREAMLHVEQQMTEQASMFHVEQAKRAKAFEQSEADREQRFEAQTTEWAQTVEQAEATRQFNEERRQSAENKRESAEKARESAERQRVDTEAVRQRQEQERGQGEAGRTTAEANRVKAEQTRVDNESSRKSAESSRVNAESQRATAESHRATAETSRATAESQRATAETNRAGAEGRRSEAESNRVTAESGRVTAESQRVTAENTREAQENARREAEEDRATRMAQWEAKAEETAQKAQEAVDSAQAFVNTNEERLLTDRDKIDYMGNQHESLKAKNDSDVDWLLGEINTVHYEGQHITATDSIEGRSKSAILRGQTLVNLASKKTTTLAPSSNDIISNDLIKSKTTYTIAINVYTLNESSKIRIRNVLHDGSYSSSILDVNIILGKNIFTVTTVDNAKNLMLNYHNSFGTSEVVIDDIVIIEDNHANIDIPYFEGMQSVKMPVLTTSTFIPMYSFLKDDGRENFTKLYTEFYEVTKDTFTFKQSGHYQRIGITTDNFEKEGKQTLERNKEYQFKIEILENTLSIDMEIRCNSKYTDGVTRIVRAGETPIYEFSKTITSEIPEDDVYGSGEMILFHLPSGYNGEVSFKVTIGYGNINNIKTSILTVNEDVELRGIGNVQDELDLLSGELTERIGEIVLDGKNDVAISISGSSNRFPSITRFWVRDRELSNLAHSSGTRIMCDKLPVRPDGDYEKITCSNGLDIHITTTKLSEETVEAFKEYLSQNPITVQYPLKAVSVKTVDLSDNHVYSYEDVTYYDCSSAEGSLVPTLSIDVPTNLPAVITRQRVTIQELEKENVALKTAVTIVDEHREEGDLELLSSDFDFELRLMEIEFAVGIPMTANCKGVRNVARTPYDMAKALILGGKYEREEMMIKLDRFEKLGSITADQKAELIALMDAVELTQ